MENKCTNPLPIPIYYCENCGSTNITPVAQCNYCGTNTALLSHDQFMEQIESWWDHGTTGEDYEIIIGLEADSFSPDNHGKEFTDACHAIWNTMSDQKK